MTETTTRLAVKALTWQATGIVCMIALGYVVSGSLAAAGQFAFGSAAMGLVLYFLHEKLWQRVRWGQR